MKFRHRSEPRNVERRQRCARVRCLIDRWHLHVSSFIEKLFANLILLKRHIRMGRGKGTFDSMFAFLHRIYSDWGIFWVKLEIKIGASIIELHFYCDGCTMKTWIFLFLLHFFCELYRRFWKHRLFSKPHIYYLSDTNLYIRSCY